MSPFLAWCRTSWDLSWKHSPNLIECYKAVVTSMNENCLYQNPSLMHGEFHLEDPRIILRCNCRYQLTVSFPPGSQWQTATRMLSLTQGLHFRHAGNLLYRHLCTNEVFVSRQERQDNFLIWNDQVFVISTTARYLQGRKQRYKHNGSQYTSPPPSSMKAKNCCRYVTFPTHRL